MPNQVDNHISKKINQIFDKIKVNGISQEDAYIHVGECMDDDALLFTDMDLYTGMENVFKEAINALKGHPEAQELLRQHFE